MLSQHYKVTLMTLMRDGWAFYPMSLACRFNPCKALPLLLCCQIFQLFLTCTPMPTANSQVMEHRSRPPAFAMSIPADKLAWEFMLLLSQDKESQQALFEKLQGPTICGEKSQQAGEILQADDFAWIPLTWEVRPWWIAHHWHCLEVELSYHGQDGLLIQMLCRIKRLTVPWPEHPKRNRKENNVSLFLIVRKSTAV